MSLKENYQQILDLLPDDVDLVAVSKNHSVEKIKEIYDLGQRVFGENKVQELLSKQALLPQNIQWHLIGHLQSKKVKLIAPFINVIQSVDSEKLLLEIDKESRKNNKIIQVLLQIKIAKEEAKFGLEIHEAEIVFENYLAGRYPNIHLIGLMGMATFTTDRQQIKSEFSYLKALFDRFSQKTSLKILSMGMSDDFRLAIECGSNSVRLGSAIFGNRM